MLTLVLLQTMQMKDDLNRLLADISRCRLCAAHLAHGPRPVLQASSSARLRIIGQAPGRKVHESGVPWSDASGKRLRAWLGLSESDFYDASKVAIVPVGFCYPGKAASGDLPPRPECAPRWHGELNALLPDIRLTLLIGQYAQAKYLGPQRKASLTETVRAWKEYLAQGMIPLPHPSPRNQAWGMKHRWFEEEVLPQLREILADVMMQAPRQTEGKGTPMNAEEFRQQLQGQGYEFVTVARESGALDQHQHDFEARALILRGEITISTEAGTQVYRPGDIFHLQAGQPHRESYGPQGVEYLAARRQ